MKEYHPNQRHFQTVKLEALGEHKPLVDMTLYSTMLFYDAVANSGSSQEDSATI